MQRRARRLRGLAFIASGLAIAGTFVLMVALDAREATPLLPVVLAVWRTAQWPAAIIFVLVSYSLIYFCGPNLQQRLWRWITPGSAFGAFVWLLGSIGFRFYVRFSNSYSASYGSLGALMILLAWLYIAGLAFLVGGEINAQIDQAAAVSRRVR